MTSEPGIPAKWWFDQIEQEIGSVTAANVRKALRSYYDPAGLSNPKRRPFFLRHFIDNIDALTQHVFAASTSPRVLDLGCGLGSQSLLYAALGAEVIAVDASSCDLEIAEQRRRYYETVLNRHLRIRFLCSDALSLKWADLPKLDAVVSVFAFNMMQPSMELIRDLAAASPPGLRLGIFDGNPSCWYNVLFRRGTTGALRPSELRQHLLENGFQVCQSHGTVALPPLFWRIPATRLLNASDSFLASCASLSVSHVCLAAKL